MKTGQQKKSCPNCLDHPQKKLSSLRKQGPVFLFALKQVLYIPSDYLAILRNDPALAKKKTGFLEAFLYPGFWALFFHRFAHLLNAAKIPLIPRIINMLARFLFGIDIHPGAKIGRGLFIDHGMGLVIGETAEIGRDVILFHQVTLGGRGNASGKRHPTLGDRVFVGAGAKILGALQIGNDARIGANAVVLQEVPQGATAVGIPARWSIVNKIKDESITA